jgi:tetratricopeptide (TPR) repeat protein
MLIKYYKFWLIVLLSNLPAIYSCTQSLKKGDISQKIISKQDSSQLKAYLLKAAQFSLFSKERGTYIDSALIIIPRNAFLWQQKAMPCFKQMKYETGMEYLDSAVKYDKATYLPYRAFIKCIFQKDYTGSILEFKTLIDSTGDLAIMDHPYSFYISLCYLQKNVFDSAFGYMNKCVREEEIRSLAKSIHFLHSFYLGVILFEKREYELAVKEFDKSLLIYHNFSDAMFYKSLCFEGLGKIKEALSLLSEADRTFKQGYTINEDNAVYERYPYQIQEFYIKNSIQRLEAKSN